jgi:hypothetical protein
MPNQSYFTGKQAEEWLRDQIKHQIYTIPQSLEEVVVAVETYLPERLASAKIYLENIFKDSDLWFERIGTRQDLQISAGLKEEFKRSILDHVLATDHLLNLKNVRGEDVIVAVDVTLNGIEVESKLQKIRGQGARDSNINRNFPKIREYLGIDKHCILHLNGDREKLPNLELLLRQLYNFANSSAKTRAIDLSNVPEQERYDWTLPPKLSAQEMWNRFSGKPANPQFIGPKQSVAAAVAALQAGYSSQIVRSMIECDPSYRQAARSGDESSNKYAEVIIKRAEEALIQPIRYLLSSLGTRQEDGSRLWETENYQVSGKGKDLQVLRRSTLECILSVRDDSISNEMTHKELNIFTKSARFVQQKFAERSKQKENPKDKSNEIER